MSYRSTVARQPQSLADCIKTASSQLENIDLTAFQSGLIGVTGIGASFAASVVIASELQRRGRRSVALRSVDLMRGGDMADGLIAISHRGRSIETVASLQAHPNAATLAMTKDETSPLAECADLHLRIDNGTDATPSSTGYTGALAVAGLLTEKLCGATSTNWANLPELASETLDRAAQKLKTIGRLFHARRAIDCVGACASLGTADGASLLVREAARIPAGAYDTRHYLHGPMESMDGTTGVIVFGDEREIQLAQQLQEIGCPVVLITSQTGIQDGNLLTVLEVPHQENLIARGILDILSAQLIAAELSDALGLTDTKFRYPQTDTKILTA